VNPDSAKSAPHRLARGALAAISAPAVPIAGLGLPLVVYLPPFYADTLGLGLPTVGLIFMIARFFDVGVDPVFGVVSDKLRVPLGRRKFWLLLSVPIVTLAAIMVFMPAKGVGGAYLLGWILLLYLGYTLFTISVVSWSAELSSDYDERTRVQGWYQTSLMLGLILVLLVPVIVTQRGGDAAAKMEAIGWLIVILSPIAVLWAVLRVKEVVVRERRQGHWREAFKAILRSKPLRYVLGADLLFGLGSGVAGALYIFAVRDGLGVARYDVILLAFFVTGCVFAPFWAWAGRRWDKHRALAFAALYTLGAPLLFLLVPQGSFEGALIVTILFGIPYASARLLLKSMMADVTDRDRLDTGRMQAGIFFSLLLTTEKLGHALSVGVTYTVLSLVGFHGDEGGAGQPNSATAVLGLMMLFLLVPLILHAAAALVLWRYPLGRAEQAQLRQALAQKYGA
jgi:Na+/melibiose symporter-like transporter